MIILLRNTIKQREVSQSYSDRRCCDLDVLLGTETASFILRIAGTLSVPRESAPNTQTNTNTSKPNRHTQIFTCNYYITTSPTLTYSGEKMASTKTADRHQLILWAMTDDTSFRAFR